MKLWVFLQEQHFINYLDSKHLANCPESLQAFLKEVGTTAISFTEQESFVPVPNGSCVRLRLTEDYLQHTTPFEKKDERRGNSCIIA